MKATIFSLIIPSRRRPEQLRRLLDSLVACTENLDDLEVVVVTDSDDEATVRFQYDAIRLKRVQVPPGTPMGALNAAGFREAAGAYVMLVNDDVIVRTPGWDQQVLNAFRSFPDGIVLVHVNDLFFKETLCIFPFLTREFCRLAGDVCPAGYIRYGIDNHIQDTFELLRGLGHDRRIYLPDVVFEHTNVKKTAGRSGIYVPDASIHEVDIRLFESLREERSGIAHAARRYIEARQSPEKPRITIGILSEDAKSADARKCVELIRTCTPNHDLILVDGTGGALRNSAHEMNRVMATCATEYLVLMHDDVFVQPGWLEGMLRSLGPRVGVVTPAHKNQRGEVSYAGIAISPDESGYAPILDLPPTLRRIQTLSGALLLIDMAKCGHIRLDEEYAEYPLDIDYGLRVWEEGFEVVCTPYVDVTHLGDAQAVPAEARQRYLDRWVASGKLRALRQEAWKTIPEICWMENQARDINRLFERNDANAFLREGPALLRRVQGYPVLKDYIASLALSRMADHPVRVDDPQAGHLAFLLGLSGRQVLFEAGFQGSNIILESFTYYAVPQQGGARYTPSFHADSPDALKALILQHRDAPAGGHKLRGARPDSAPRPLTELVQHASTEASGSDAAPRIASQNDVSHLTQGLASRDVQIAELAGLVHRSAAGVDARWAANPLLHFLNTGAYRGCKPNPLFDPTYYLAANPDVAASGVNPLAHFLETGALQGRRPNPLFDTAYYLEKYPDVVESGMNPLEHFLKIGTAKGYKPNPLFDTSYYLHQSPELAAGGINPLADFLESGAERGRKPNALFDTTYYVEQNPDLAGMNPLAHFLQFGASHGCKPNALFDTNYYVKQNPNAAENRMNPLAHFLECGAAKGCKPNPFFDPVYYLQHNPDVAQAGINPLAHFLELGAKQGLRPNPLFDSAYYLLQNPEVAAARINPLAHFLEHAGTSRRNSHPSPIAHQLYGSSNGSPPTGAVQLSVVIATYNHRDQIAAVVEACQRYRGGCEMEIIVVDAGSTDDTRSRLSELALTAPDLRYYFLDAPGLAQARNIGADLARHEVILFLDEEACPANDDFFRVHASLHHRYPDTNLAVLGRVTGSSRSSDGTTRAMEKIFGRGGAQFGNFDLTPYAFVSWPYFDTANVSVKKAFVSDWILEGFEAGPIGSPYEDLELAGRISKSSDGLRLFYDPTAVAVRTQRPSLAEQMDHQFSLGKALANLVQRNPEFTIDSSPEDFLGALRAGRHFSGDNLAADYRLLLDGVTACARVLEDTPSESWHAEFQAAALELCLLDGFVSVWTKQGGDVGTGLPLVAEYFRRRLPNLGALLQPFAG